MKNLQSLMLLLVCFVAVSCNCNRPDVISEKGGVKIENVVRVMMNDTLNYTIFVDIGNGRLDQRQICVGFRVFGAPPAGKLQFFNDVPNNEKMWVYLERYNRIGFWEHVDIHIHSAKNIEGGDWQRTVNGLVPFSHVEKGHTHVIE